MTDAQHAAPVIERTAIDGVPVLWIDEPGPTVANLVFRVGRADEPTPMGGISHIVEHLALARLGVQDFEHNGMVNSQWTVFMSVGRSDELVSFLDAVVEGLADPPLDRLRIERRILREERERRGPSIGAALRWYRYGYAGQGRGLGPADDELGLEWLGPEPARAWINRWFTRQNALLWMTGPPPAGLRFDRLPDGPGPTAPSTESIPGLVFPVHLPWDGPGATLGFVAERTAAIHMAMNVIQRRAMQRLRFDQGLVYGVELDYEPVAPRQAHVLLGGECQDERVTEVTDGLLEVVRTVASDGPTQAELDHDYASHVRSYADRDGRISLLAATAFDTLWGGEIRTGREFAEERRTMRPEAAGAAVAAAMDTMLVLANRLPIVGLATYPGASTTKVDGRETGPAGFFLPGRKPKDRLISGPDGLTVVLETGEWLTVRYENVVGVEHVTPDVRVVLGRDGMRVAVDRAAWKDGPRVVDEIDRSIPVDLIACAEHGVGGLEDEPGADTQSTTGTAGVG